MANACPSWKEMNSVKIRHKDWQLPTVLESTSKFQKEMIAFQQAEKRKQEERKTKPVVIKLKK